MMELHDIDLSCPGCGNLPGDGIGCSHPDGCGYQLEVGSPDDFKETEISFKVPPFLTDEVIQELISNAKGMNEKDIVKLTLEVVCDSMIDSFKSLKELL